ncbi:MAG: IgGFc-binding protein [Prevotella sp.]|nr:IgGFc-binding protein [Prevotella sp.]
MLGFILLSYWGTDLKAQDTEFWFAAPDISGHNSGSACGFLDSPILLAISNATGIAGEVTLTLYNNGSPIVVTNTIPANGLWKYDIPDANKGQVENPLASAGNVTKYGIHIKTTVPVTAYYQVLAPCNQDVFALKGSNALGRDFYVPMMYDSYYYTSLTYNPVPYDQIDIVASEDDTEVTIVPPKAIRIGVAGSSAIGNPITKTLNKGETLKIMEHVVGSTRGSTSLAGTKITSTKPIAVTTTEDLVTGGAGVDVIGDQIVPVNAVGKNYVVNKGFLKGSDRAYMVAIVDGTTISVDSGTGSLTTSGVLNAGDSWVFDLGTNGYLNAAPQVVFITADNPIYCYHVSGVSVNPGTTENNELGSGLMPSIYSIGQTQLSFYQYAGIPASDTHSGFIVFRAGTSDKFTIRQDAGAYSALTVTPIAIPGNADWQAAKITLPTSGQNKAITIKNSESPFSFGYFSSNSVVGGASYGYLSAFGDFKFPNDTIYQCPDATFDREY